MQQGQATSFATDNYNLDMQWLGTVDQPLLEEAMFWSERAQGESGMAAVEDNTQAALAPRVAAEPAGNRQDESVTIHNTQTGNPTQRDRRQAVGEVYSAVTSAQGGNTAGIFAQVLKAAAAAAAGRQPPPIGSHTVLSMARSPARKSRSAVKPRPRRKSPPPS